MTNLDNYQSITFSSLLPFFIERYGFYGGEEAHYRVAPQEIVAVFDFLNAGEG
ncbi:MAG: hypothetical protein HQM16_18595 [Deltaproteobacteria bacterium]|nr:hypothetical protein [Deltaproteobacteria bacterium]